MTRFETTVGEFSNRRHVSTAVRSDELQVDPSGLKVTMATWIGAAVGYLPILALIGCSVTHYGVRDGLIISTFYGGMLCFTALFGWIPVVGPLLYGQIARRGLMPMLIGWFPWIQTSWITEAYYWIGLLVSVLFTLIASFVIVAIWFARRARPVERPYQ